MRLHQIVVGARAAVHLERGKVDARIRPHGGKHVARLVGDAVERGADDVVLVAAACKPHNGAACILVPMRRAKARKSRHHIAAVGVRNILGKVFGLRRGIDEAHFVAEPLYSRARHKNGTLERIGHFVVVSPCDGRHQPVFRKHRGLTGIHEQKAARAVRVFGFARRKAGLPEQRRLLVARRAGNGNCAAKIFFVGIPENTA